MTTYQEALEYLEKLEKFGDEPGLHRMERMLGLLGDPHKPLKCVHITGTDGKGSTSAMTASIIKSAGYKVGLFTSPHLYKYNERIKLNGVDISDVDFVSLLHQVKDVLIKNTDIKPALFEVITVMAFLHFNKHEVDVAVIEVGLGGRLDSTNVIDGIVCAITNINLEHAKLFGGTREGIALEKAGIVKPNSLVFTSEGDESIRRLIENEAEKMGAILEYVSQDDIQLKEGNSERQIFSFKKNIDLELPLLGPHQLLNASVAISCALALNKRGFTISSEHIRDGLRTVRWPLRLEVVHHEPTILIDVAHNPYGVKVVKRSVDELFTRQNRLLILGCSFDKPYKRMANSLSDLSDVIILTRAKYHGVNPKKLLEAINPSNKKVYETASVQEAMVLAKKLIKEDSLLMVLGGLYLGAEAKECIADIFEG